VVSIDVGSTSSGAVATWLRTAAVNGSPCAIGGGGGGVFILGGELEPEPPPHALKSPSTAQPMTIDASAAREGERKIECFMTFSTPAPSTDSAAGCSNRWVIRAAGS
jgi:hypothetical protein